MRQKSGPEKQPAEETIRDIRRATRRHFSAEEKIRVVLEGLRGEESIAELCRREGIASGRSAPRLTPRRSLAPRSRRNRLRGRRRSRNDARRPPHHEKRR
jgi:transposase-like protein